MQSKRAPSWLNVDAGAMTGRIVTPPPVGEMPTVFDPAVIVEFYSR
jgi:ribosomal protein S4